MTRKNIIVGAQAATLLAVIPVMMFGNLAGPNAGVSGAMGEQNCEACHSSNNGGGGVSIAFPKGLFYTPGTNQHWVVSIEDLSGKSWGFQLTTRQSGTTTQAGSYQPGGEAFTQVLCANGYDPTATSPALKQQFLTVPQGTPCPTGYSWQWIEQTWNPAPPLGNPQLGARINAGDGPTVTFEFDWIPPSSAVGSIDVNIAAVAGNGTNQTSGGNVYINHYVLTVPVANQPAITQGGVVNGASYQPQSTIGPNTWVTIYGTNLANTTAVWGKADFKVGNLPTLLDGVSVTIGGAAAYVEYVSPTQVNVLTPPTLPLGTNLNVQLLNNTLESFPGTVTTQAEAPALFEWNSKYAVATHADFSFVGPAGLFPNATTTPAKPGDTVILWATGLGTTNPPLPEGKLPTSGTIYNAIHTPAVTVGGKGAQLVSAVLSPQFPGLYQVAFIVPSGLSSGDQPIVLSSGSYSSAAGVSLTIGN